MSFSLVPGIILLPVFSAVIGYAPLSGTPEKYCDLDFCIVCLFCEIGVRGDVGKVRRLSGLLCPAFEAGGNFCHLVCGSS